MSAVTHARPLSTRRGLARTRPDGQPRSRTLRLVDAAPSPHRNALFAVLCLAMVLAGLATALVLNTQRAQASFALADLREEAVVLHDERVTLEAQLAQYRSPDALAERAADLGMVPSPSTAVLRLSDGAVLGVAATIVDDRARTVATTGPAAEDSSQVHAGDEAASGAPNND